MLDLGHEVVVERLVVVPHAHRVHFLKLFCANVGVRVSCAVRDIRGSDRDLFDRVWQVSARHPVRVNTLRAASIVLFRLALCFKSSRGWGLLPVLLRVLL